jgi:hypothetical protein
MLAEDAILYTSLSAFLLGTGGIIYYGYIKGFFDFLTYAHYVSLLFLVVSGVLTWGAMVWMISPENFKVEKRQYISLGISVLISILWWGRYAYTVADSSETNKNLSNLKWGGNKDEDDV